MATAVVAESVAVRVRCLLRPELCRNSDCPRKSSNMPAHLKTIRTILDRYSTYRGRLNLPGEGWERAFRGWLVMDYLRDVLSWPTSRILFGERFDVLLLDEDLHPVINIETKAPDHEASEQEIQDFEQRFPFYATLRWAFFTNGKEWCRLALHAPDGQQTISERKALSLQSTTDRSAADFFDPLDPRHYLV